MPDPLAALDKVCRGALDLLEWAFSAPAPQGRNHGGCHVVDTFDS